MTLYRVPLTDELWRQFIAWYALRNVPKTEWPVRPDHGLWVALENGTLIAGACLYAGVGPYVICEFLSTNPEASITRGLAHSAVEICAAALKEYAACVGKPVLIFSPFASIQSIIGRHGFKQLETPCFAADPYIQFLPTGEKLEEAVEALDAAAEVKAPDEGGDLVEGSQQRGVAGPKPTPIATPVNRRARRAAT